jgi:multidrug transporter EmrE-like cation transporter
MVIVQPKASSAKLIFDMTKFYLYIAIINLLDLLAIIAGKMWYLTGRPVYLILCSLGFALAGIFFALSLKFEGAAITNILWISISVILVAIVGYFVFKENINLIQFFGIIAVLIGVVLLNIRTA